MRMLSNLLYYVFFSSIVLYYGIGLDRAIIISKKQRNLSLKIVKILLCVTSTSCLTYLFVNNFLVPYDLGDIFPFVEVLIFIGISVFIEALIRITAKISAAEFSITYLFIFISVSESTTLGECVVISILCTLAFFLLIPFLYSINHHLELNSRKREFDKIGYVLVSIAVVMLILLCGNVSWLGKGVLK